MAGRASELGGRRPCLRGEYLVKVAALGLLVLSACSSGGAGAAARVPTTLLTVPPSAVAASSAVTATVPPLVGRYVYPLEPSADGRSLVDQRGTPFFMVGDSAQSAAVNLTLAEAEQYFDARAAAGFNTVNINAMEHKFGQGGKGANLSGVPTNRNGDLPFLKNDRGEPYDGTWGTADFATPNDKYFAFTAALVDLAATKGLAVTLAYSYLGINGGSEGWWSDLTNDANKAQTAYNFGLYLAKGHGPFSGFKDKKNVILVVGGDYTPPSDDGPESGETRLYMVMKGLRDGGASQVQAGDWAAPTFSTTEERFAGDIQVNGVYLCDKTYEEARKSYAYVPATPAYLKETGYELENWCPGDPASVRKYQYWAVLSGSITGVAYGHRDVWDFATDSWNNGFPFGHAPWTDALQSQGTGDMTRMAALFGSVRWQDLVPSELAGMKRLVTSKNGSQGRDDYVAAAATPNGQLLLAYVPPTDGSSTQLVTIDTSAMTGPSRAQWWSPGTGQFIEIAPAITPGAPVEFQTPGANGAGSNDWLLVLTTSSANAGVGSTASSVPG
jgi:hypothetical protein